MVISRMPNRLAGLLESAGHVEFQGLLGNAGQAESGTIVPGGLDALAFAAHAQEHVPPEKFLRSILSDDSRPNRTVLRRWQESVH